MVILNIEVLVPGHEVGRVLGNVNADTARNEEAAGSTLAAGNARPAAIQQPAARPAPPRPSKICFSSSSTYRQSSKTKT